MAKARITATSTMAAVKYYFSGAALSGFHLKPFKGMDVHVCHPDGWLAR